jgi:hypothetical protein
LVRLAVAGSGMNDDVQQALSSKLADFELLPTELSELI